MVCINGGKSGSKDRISPFQAFYIGMATRVGTGNITGIAIAIALGESWSCILDVDYFYY